MKKLFFFVLLVSANVYAASFDCHNASTSIEKMICDDNETSKLDEEMSKIYAESIKKLPNSSLLKKEQRDWIEDERKLCSNFHCLRAVYLNRINELKTWSPPGTLTTVLVKNNSMCESYKNYIEHEMMVSSKHVGFVKPMCQRNYGEEDFSGFEAVQWREIAPENYPNLAVQAYRYIKFWPWNRKEVASHLDDREYDDQLSIIKLNHSNGWWRMWLGKSDIDNDGHADTLLKIETDGKCGEESIKPPLWKVPVMIVDKNGKGIDTKLTDKLLGVTVRSSTSFWPSNIKPIPGAHSLTLSAFDVFSFSKNVYFDRWENEWAIPQTAIASRRYATLSVYRIFQDNTTEICRFKYKKK